MALSVFSIAMDALRAVGWNLAESRCRDEQEGLQVQVRLIWLDVVLCCRIVP